LTNQNVRRDGAKTQPERIAVRWPEEKANSRSSSSADASTTASSRPRVPGRSDEE
jgi:hypothetical protein